MGYANRFSFKSIRFKLVFVFLIVVLPLIAFLIYNNLYSIKVVRNQVAQSNKNLINLYMGQIDRNLDEADNYLFNLAAQETDLLGLELSENENNQEYNSAKIRLDRKISADILSYRAIDLFFIYSIANQDLVSTQIPGETLNDRKMVRDDIIQIFQDKPSYSFDQWFIRKKNNDYFLCHIVKVGKVYVGAWVNAKKIMVPLNMINLGEVGKALLVTEKEEPMAEAAFIRDNQIDLAYERNVYSLRGNQEKFLVVGGQSSKGNFSLVALIPDSTILENLPYLKRIVYFILFGSFFIVLLILYFLRKVILLPINRIMAAMRRIKNGDWEARIASYPTSIEFDMMNETFNRLVVQIQELKINIYEEQLNNQKIELKHLQLQINPHFFLNSLNIIFHLAQVKDYILIQEMSLCLVQYFRYMFRSNMSFVMLEDEIKHTRNYLKIQEMRFPGHFTYDVMVEDSFGKCHVPPLLIQTFVENTIKHVVNLDDPIHILIVVTLDKTVTNPWIKIRIQDTGKGFSEDVLRQLQLEMETINEQGEHIGIWNVQRRLRLLYHGKAQISFSNSGGAVIEIRLPFYEEGSLLQTLE